MGTITSHHQTRDGYTNAAAPLAAMDAINTSLSDARRVVSQQMKDWCQSSDDKDR